jgi:transposase
MDDQADRISGQLHQEMAQLRAENEALRAEVERLRAENQALRDQLEQAQRVAARQAAPFRRRERQKVAEDARKRPGRKEGHVGSYRPSPSHIDETHEVPLACCPRCGGPIDDVCPVEQIIEEIPPLRPRVHKVIIYRATCPRCGEVRSRHPLQTSEAQGAAKVQLGPRALGIAVLLNKHLGLTMRKTCRVLKDLLGLSLTPGGLSQAADRVADRLAGAYDALVQDVRGSPAVNADETSWWVGGPGWWLWTFTTPSETVYRVDNSRGSVVVREVLGEKYAGVLGSDCLSSYDPIDCRKHKCIAHHLRAIAKARQLPGQKDDSYLHEWELLFKTVIALHGLATEGIFDAAELAAKRQRVKDWADELLGRPRGQPGDVSVQNRLRKQREHLLGCLYDLAAEPTNNRAERALRPAVIARKVSCGNKTDRGRRTWQVLTSLAETCRQRGQDFLAYVTRRLPLRPQAR